VGASGCSPRGAGHEACHPEARSDRLASAAAGSFLHPLFSIRSAFMSVTRLWPTWASTVGGMLDAASLVAFRCKRCGTHLRVDVEAIAARRGRDASLVDAIGHCKVWDCPGRGYFLAALGPTTPLRPLVSTSVEELFRRAPPPPDHDPDNDPDRPPPCPPGINAVTWAYATASERKRLVGQARG